MLLIYEGFVAAGGSGDGYHGLLKAALAEHGEVLGRKVSKDGKIVTYTYLKESKNKDTLTIKTPFELDYLYRNRPQDEFH